MKDFVKDFITPEEQALLLDNFEDDAQWRYSSLSGIKLIIADRVLEHLGIDANEHMYVRYESRSKRDFIHWHNDQRLMTDKSPCDYGCCIMLSNSYEYTGGALKYEDCEVTYEGRAMAYHTGDERHCVTPTQGVRKTFLIFM